MQSFAKKVAQSCLLDMGRVLFWIGHRIRVAILQGNTTNSKILIRIKPSLFDIEYLQT